MYSMLAKLENSQRLMSLIYGFLFVVFLTDSLTPASFAHGILYSPALLFAALTANDKSLRNTFLLCIVLTWSGLLISQAPTAGADSFAGYADRFMTTVVLVVLYGLSLLTLTFHQQQRTRQDQLKLASELAHLGYWQRDSDGNIQLSAEAATLLQDPKTVSISPDTFASKFISEDQTALLAFLTASAPDNTKQEQDFRLQTADGTRQWMRISVQNTPHAQATTQGVLQDIHFMRTAKDFIDEEQRRFHLMAEDMQLFAWTADPHGRLTFVSNYIINFLGDTAENIQQNWLTFLHSEDQQRTLTRWQQSLKSGEQYVVEFRLRRHNGLYFWFLTRATAARDDNGLIFKWYGSSIEITETKLLQQQSEALSQQLQITLGSITDAFFTLNKHFQFSYANEQAARLVNCARSALLNQYQFSQTLLAEDGSLQRLFERAMIAQSLVSSEFWFAAKHTWLDVRVYPSSQGLTVYLRDITKQRKAQQELQLMQNAVSQLNDIVIITETLPAKKTGAKIVFVNDAFERIMGYQRQEVIGRSTDFLHGPNTDPEELQRITQALVIHQPIRTQLTHYNKAQQEIILEINLVPISVEKGRYSHIVSIQRDISAEKALQAQLQLAQRMEAIGQLTGGIAHDFNNLLTVITGNAELLTDQLEAQPRLKPLAKLIADAANRGAALTRNLLAFAKRQPLSPEPVDINKLIVQLEALLKSSLGQHIKLQLKLEPGLWPVNIDPVQLESSLLNLVINARDAMANKGRLFIHTQNLREDTNARPLDAKLEARDYVLIEVQDNGAGIAPDIVDRIFEPFFTTKTVGSGSGLGLSMVFGFIKQSGGQITVKSLVGEGTCFRLYLPTATAITLQLQQPVVVAALAVPQPQQRTILVVEDNDLVRHYAVSQLRSAGYQILAAENAEQALTWLKSEQTIDLLFTDILLPRGMDGRALAKQATQLREGLTVLYTSGYMENALADLSEKQHAQWVLHKPYHRTALLQKISQALAVEVQE